MIDLDLLESAIKKVWFTRTPEEDGAINRVNDTVGLIELITRLRQAEKDAARYRWLRDEAYAFDISDFFMCSQVGEKRDAFADEAMNASNN